jgi:predicted neutral ceramidase superfamily lipid hydrolase
MALDLTNEKREILIYITVILWILFGVAVAFYPVSYAQMAVYFLSLTGFVSAYIWGESVRKSSSSSIFATGRTSSREKMIYVTVFLWTALGVTGLLTNADFVNLSAYFGALTPFVSAYILGKAYKPNGDPENPDEPAATTTTTDVKQVAKPAEEIG